MEEHTHKVLISQTYIIFLGRKKQAKNHLHLLNSACFHPLQRGFKITKSRILIFTGNVNCLYSLWRSRCCNKLFFRSNNALHIRLSSWIYWTCTTLGLRSGKPGSSLRYGKKKCCQWCPEVFTTIVMNSDFGCGRFLPTSIASSLKRQIPLTLG